MALDELDEKWGSKYAASVESWKRNWPQLSTYMKYPPEIRKMIYTTNSIENFNRQLLEENSIVTPKEAERAYGKSFATVRISRFLTDTEIVVVEGSTNDTVYRVVDNY